MAIVNNVELWWVKVDAERPVKNVDPSKPDYWEVQLRTTDKAAAAAYAKESINFKPLKRIVKDASGQPMLDDFNEKVREIVKCEKTGKPYFSVNVRKKVIKADGSAQLPVQLLGGDLSSINPKEVGNGSVANVRLFQYDYTYQGKEGRANMLMAIQVTHLLKYEQKPQEDAFKMTEMKVITIGDNQVSDSLDDNDDLDF